MASVTLENVVKKYGDVVAVNNVNLHFADQEFVALVGPSGCGKTTLLRMIAGLEEITSGTIKIGDRIVNDLPPKDRDIAMVFQNYALYPHMTIEDNMTFSLRIKGKKKSEIAGKVLQVAQILGIEHLLKRKPGELSGGQRQRVALGRAIMREPQVFLMDEPLSNLDAKLRVQMRVEITRLHQRLKRTIIYVTHDQIEAMTMADRIVVMKDGVIQQADTPLNIYKNPANKFVAGFIGSPPMNFLDGTLSEENGQLWFVGAGFRLPVSGAHRNALVSAGEKSVTLGIRPDAVLVGGEAFGADNGRLDAGVDIVELHGSDQLAYLEIADGIQITAKLLPAVQIKHGDKVTVNMDMLKAYYFSNSTEKALV
ncbi:ABC transporter ATP-binding protein [Thermincola potens]|uniref:ABC transporter related protein n=1 Tax=Thermincola potens (strain JR) TaxID=635013 RepID=D5X9W7_THEPJ|nr:sn-glycerol-3-phosphate ABC transporter ATP-binding protein UgpC [Thermincola potens]ADG83100.1 ABC transporter related protein [Thermincola potens JR]